MMRTPTFLLALGLLSSARPLDARAESAPAPSVAISNLSIVEGDSGMTPFSATLSLVNFYYGTLPLTVRVTATPGTASDRDFVFTTTEVTLGTDAGVPTVSGFIVGDIEPEGDETFTLTATLVARDGGYAPYFYSSGGMITIKDDDQSRASRLHAEGVTLLEGTGGTKQAEVRVSLEPASSSDVKVKYQSQDGTAVGKVDYVPVSGTLAFAPGEVLKTIVVDILGDADFEADETFSVVLSDPSMALLGSPRAEVVIVNDDIAATQPDASPDVLPPTGAVEAPQDGGVSTMGFDAKPSSDDVLPAGNDSGALGPGGSSGNESGEGEGTAFGGGCSCSVAAGAQGSAGMLLLLGVCLAGWLGRKRR